MWRRDLRRFPSLPSTQAAALGAAEAGAGEGTAFLAATQTAGRGRHGHSWASPPGSGMYLSIVLRPQRPVPDLMLLTLAVGLGVADAVALAAGVHPDLRWPNDLLLGGRKFCGVLLESAGMHAALGIGVNVRPAALPPEVAGLATALDRHSAAAVDFETLLDAVLSSVERRYGAWNAGGADTALLEEFERRCPYVRDAAVLVGGQPARTEGLDPAGFLRVRFADGHQRLVVTGDVRPAGD